MQSNTVVSLPNNRRHNLHLRRPICLPEPSPVSPPPRRPGDRRRLGRHHRGLRAPSRPGPRPDRTRAGIVYGRVEGYLCPRGWVCGVCVFDEFRSAGFGFEGGESGIYWKFLLGFREIIG